VDRLEERVIRPAPTLGLTIEEAGQITMAWFTVNDWIPSLLLPLQHKRVRHALPQRARLTAAAEAMADHAQHDPWLLGLLHVLDDEPLVVAHRDSGRVYELTISDRRQLPTAHPARRGAHRRSGPRPDPRHTAAPKLGRRRHRR
jgi:hypothetical protein